MAVAVRERVTSTTSGATHTASLPAYVKDDFWLWVLWTRGTTMPNVTAPTGWTRVASRVSANSGSSPGFAIYARVPDGTEGPSASVTLGNSGNARSAIYALTGANLDVQFTNTGTNSILAGAGRDSINNTPTTVAPTVSSFGNAVEGSLAVQVATFCAGVGITFETSRTDMAVDYRQVNATGTNVISAGIALSTTPLPAGPTGDFNGTSDQSTRWTHAVITIAPAPVTGPVVSGAGTGSAETSGTAAGAVLVAGAGRGDASAAGVGNGITRVQGAGRGDANASASGAGSVLVRGAGAGQAISDGQGMTGASQVIAGGRGSAETTAVGAGAVLVRGQAQPVGAMTNATGAGKILVAGAGRGDASSGARAVGTVLVLGEGLGDALTGGQGEGLVIDVRPLRDVELTYQLEAPSWAAELLDDDDGTHWTLED